MRDTLRDGYSCRGTSIIPTVGYVMSDITREAALANMADDELVDFTCFMYESLKRLDESKRVDETLKDMKKAVTDYEYKNYGYETKIKKLQLRAARVQLAQRGVTFNFEAQSHDRQSDTRYSTKVDEEV